MGGRFNLERIQAGVRDMVDRWTVDGWTVDGWTVDRWTVDRWMSSGHVS